MQTFNVPIFFNECKTKKKNFYLNLNNFVTVSKNVFRRNKLKQKYKSIIIDTVKQLKPVAGPVRITYTVYRQDKTMFDIDNVGSIISKFTNDVLVCCAIIKDDDYVNVPEIIL